MSSPSSGTATARRRRVLPSPRRPQPVEADTGDTTPRVRDHHDVGVVHSPHRDRGSEVKDAVIVAMAAALLVTTPLAVLTARRWLRWWNTMP